MGDVFIPDAFKPISMMIFADHKMKFIRADDGLDNLRVAGIEWFRAIGVDRVTAGGLVIAACNKNPSSVPSNFIPLGSSLLTTILYPVRIQRFGLKNTVNVPQSFRWKLSAAPYLNGPGAFHPHSPMSRIDVMRTPTRDHSCSKLLAAKPARSPIIGLGVNALLRVIHRWG